jgi:hypothetical protein
MKGIKLSHGVIFATDGLITVRLSKSGECEVSPIEYEVLEWDLRTEPPEKWEYVSEAELRALPDGAYDRIAAVFDKVRKLIGE